jgi:hypothetical protein
VPYTAGLQRIVQANAVLGQDRADLAAILKGSAYAPDIAEALRSISLHTRVASDTAARASVPPSTAELVADVSATYVEIDATASAALENFVSNTTAYRNAGKAMVTLLGQLAALDTELQAAISALNPEPATSQTPDPSTS